MEWIELGKLIEFQKKSKIKAGDGKIEGKYLMYTSSMLVDKYLDEYQYSEEALIMGTGGNASIHYSSGKFGTSTDCYVIYNKGAKALLKYIYYYLLGNIYILEEGFRGAGLKHTNQKYIKNIKIPILSVEAQEKIVKVLDQAQALIDKRKEQIQALDQLIESIFYTMFGDPVRNEKDWEVKGLGELGIFKNGLNYSKGDNGYSIKCLGVGDFLRLNKIENMSKIQKIDLLEKPNSDYLLKDEDILFVRSNGNKKLVGRNIIVYPGDNEVTFSGFCIRFRKMINNLNPIFLNYQIKKRTMQNRLQSKIRGANIQNLNQKILSDLDMIYPPISLQNEFAQKVEVIEKQKEALNQSLELLGENYKSIMDKAFKGQLFN